MKTARALSLLTASTLLLLIDAAGPARATSVFRNVVETDTFTNEPFDTRQAPWTLFHPNPIHGFATSQGVSALFGDGSGLAVHARADLVPEASFTKSTATAAIEFTIVDPTAHTQVPVDVSFVGEYLTGVFGAVRVHLWRGAADCRFCGITNDSLERLFFAGNVADPDVGVWSVERTLLTRERYALELTAEAGAFSGFNASSVAFIDPVISFDAGPGVELEIEFDEAATLVNPDFIAVPEPTPLVLGGSLALACLGARAGQRRPAA